MLILNGFTNHTAEPFEYSYASVSGKLLVINQIKSMFLKKYLSYIRAWKISLLQTTLSMFYIIVIVVIVRSFPNNVVLPPLSISFDSYAKTVTVLETNSPNASIAKSYAELFIELAPTNKLVTISSPFSEYILNKVCMQRYFPLPLASNKIFILDSQRKTSKP